jgi:hypothetical protein
MVWLVPALIEASNKLETWLALSTPVQLHVEEVCSVYVVSVNSKNVM